MVHKLCRCVLCTSTFSSKAVVATKKLKRALLCVETALAGKKASTQHPAGHSF